MKKIYPTLILLVLGITAFAEKDNNVCYVDLGDKSEYVPYLPHFKTVFDKMKIRGLLQFGIGFSTKYFLDSCDKVFSVEIVTHGCGPEAAWYYLDKYRDYSNWIPIMYLSDYRGTPSWAPYKYLGSDAVYRAVSYQTITHQSYANIDDFYLVELNAFMKNLVRCNTIDVASIDGNCYLRGDFVQLLFGKVPLIFAYGTHIRVRKEKDDLYGYTRIDTPDDYEEIFLNADQGTTAWISKDPKYKEIARALKVHALEYSHK